MLNSSATVLIETFSSAKLSILCLKCKSLSFNLLFNEVYFIVRFQKRLIEFLGVGWGIAVIEIVKKSENCYEN